MRLSEMARDDVPLSLVLEVAFVMSMFLNNIGEEGLGVGGGGNHQKLLSIGATKPLIDL